MTVIVSETSLVEMPANWWPSRTNVSVRLYNGLSMDYAVLYRTQPNVRTCVDFLSRNIAQLGVHVYRRTANDDRVRLRDHGLAALISQPLPPQYKVTRYRLIENTMGDLGVYFNAYWLKIRTDGKLSGLLRIPPELVTPKGKLNPQGYVIDLGQGGKEIDAADVVHFRGYNAEDAVSGLSPLETLRRVLAEEYAAGDYREHFWENAARMYGVIERPKDAPDWSETARARFKAEFEALYAGGENSGRTAILEEGMTWKAISFNPEQAGYLEGRKLTREECSRAYHIPPPLVGILDHATYSNIEEQHKGLYTDVLGPWISMLEQDILLQLANDFDDMEGVYLEFNIQEKMQGNFAEQTKSLQSSIGRPWMTVNEGRRVMNLPMLDGGDELVTPLNVLVGGQASPNDSAPKEAPFLPAKSLTTGEGKDESERYEVHRPDKRVEHETDWRKLLVRTFERQRNAILPKIKAAKGMNDINLIWDGDRWDDEVTEDFRKLSFSMVLFWAELMAELLEIKLDETVLREYVENNARIAAEYMNQSTREQVEAALAEEDPKAAIESVFELALSVRVMQLASGRVSTLLNYGQYSAARQGGMKTKTWIVRSNNPRDSHKRMNGETVGIRERFSNGLRWPGDHQGGAEENANCQCELAYGR